MDPQQPDQPKPYAPKPRFLAPKARAGDGLGYVNLPAMAMPHEPECLDEDDWVRHVGKPAAIRKTAEELGVERAAKLLSQEERMTQAHKDAAVKQRDVRREMWILRSMLDNGKTPDAIEKRLQGLERIVYLGRAA